MQSLTKAPQVKTRTGFFLPPQKVQDGEARLRARMSARLEATGEQTQQSQNQQVRSESEVTGQELSWEWSPGHRNKD